MKQKAKSWLKFILQCGIAVIGIWLVVRTISLRDRVTLVDPATAVKTDAYIVGKARETDRVFTVVALNPSGHEVGLPFQVRRDELWARPDRKTIDLFLDGEASATFRLLAVHTMTGKASDGQAAPDALLIQDPNTGKSRIVPLSAVVHLDQYLEDHIAYPRVEVGLIRMVKDAKLFFLLASLAVIPISILVTSIRWHMLLEAVSIHIGMTRTFAINMVGLFYNAFMLGSTGGDLVKAYYASRHTPHRTWAVISVAMDRGIGLLALIILGGTMAAVQWQIPACRKVACAAALLLGITTIGFVVFYSPALRRLTGFDFLLGKLPAQRFLHTAVKGLEMYGHDHPAKSIVALLISFPVHASSIISATLAGHALGLKLPMMFYWVMVPVTALVGAIPISPQGAGVMEGFAILLTQGQGVTTSQAVGLVLAMRMTQMFWNLVAGLFLLRGDYHAPTESEKHELDEDESDLPPAPIPVPA